MAEHASDASLPRQPDEQRHARHHTGGSATVVPRSSDPTAARPDMIEQRAPAPPESALERYAFYVFVGTMALGVIAMIVLTLTI